MEEEEKKRKESNSGYCFVIMKNSYDAAPFFDNDYFQEKLTDSHYFSLVLNFKEAITSEAFIENDIIWENLDSNQMVAKIKQFVFCILLLVFFLILMTPANVLS